MIQLAKNRLFCSSQRLHYYLKYETVLSTLKDLSVSSGDLVCEFCTLESYFQIVLPPRRQRDLRYQRSNGVVYTSLQAPERVAVVARSALFSGEERNLRSCKYFPSYRTQRAQRLDALE